MNSTGKSEVSSNWKSFCQEYTPRLVWELRKGYSKSDFWRDFFAGLTVAIVALPLAMAFAIASGVGPERGLATAIVAGVLISALGGSRVQIGGPTGAFVVIIYGIVERYGYEGLVTATIMAGFILILLGLARFGRMIKFIPYPVTTGFTAGIALIIFTGQIKDFFGFNIQKLPSEFIPKWSAYFAASHTINLSALLCGSITLGTFLIMRKFYPRAPGAIIAIVLGTVTARFFGLDLETIGSKFGEIPRSLPPPELPAFSFAQARELVPEAFTVALLAGIESLLSAVVADGMTGDRHNSNCELVSQGTANIAVMFFGGIPATGAIARTATNVKSGARTPIAGILHAVILLVLMMAFAPFAGYIPLTCLAAILFVIAYNMSELHHFVYLLRAPRSDVLILLVTFALTVLVDLTVAVETGVVLAALAFMKRMSEVTEAASVTAVFQDEASDFTQLSQQGALLKRTVPAGVEVFQMSGPFFFGVADRFKDVLDRIEKRPRYLILRMRKVPVVDASGLHMLRELHSKCHRQGIHMLLSGVQPSVERYMKRIGLWQQVGQENIFANIDAALDRVETWLNASQPEKSQ